MLYQISSFLQGTWVYVLREPDEVVLVLGLVLPLVLIGSRPCVGPRARVQRK